MPTAKSSSSSGLTEIGPVDLEEVGPVKRPFETFGIKRGPQSMARPSGSLARDITGTLPYIGGAAGAAAGSYAGPGGMIAGAAAGGAIGEDARQITNSVLNIETEEDPKRWDERTASALTRAAEQAVYEAGGQFIGKLGVWAGFPGGQAMKNAENQMVKAFGQRQGLKLTSGEITGTALPSTLQAVGEYGRAGREVTKPIKVANYEKLADFVNHQLDQFSVVRSNTVAGEKAVDVFRVARKNFRDFIGGEYAAVNQGAPDAKVSLKGISNEISKGDVFKGLREEFPELFPSSGARKSVMAAGAPVREEIPASTILDASGKPMREATVKETEREVSFADAHQLRSRALEIARESKDKDALRAANAFSKAVDQRMSLEAQSAGVYDAWRNANDLFRKGTELFESTTLRKLSRLDPEMVAASIKPKEITKINRLKDVLVEKGKDQGAWDAVRRHMVNEWFFKDGDFSLLEARITQVTPEVRAAVFDDATGKAVWKNLNEMAVTARRMGKSLNPLGTPEGHLSMGEHFRSVSAAADLALQNYKGVSLRLAELMAPAAFAKIAYSDAATKYFTRALPKLVDKRLAGTALADIYRAIQVSDAVGDIKLQLKK